jgi:hypothetical protein
MSKQGIIITSTIHGLYSQFAFNLLLTIKAIEPDCQVSLVHDAEGVSHLQPHQLGRFDYLIPAEVTGFGGKLALDLISPFDRTIVLDADMAWMPMHPPSTLFANLEDAEFTAITEGKIDLSTNQDESNGRYFWWADIEEIKSVYKLTQGTLYQFRSEMMYFTKSANVKKMFALARKIYKNPRLKSLKRFGSQVPDELALNIACALTDMHPHRYKWSPSFWPKLHGENVRNIEEIYNSYYLLSAGSHVPTPTTRRLYEGIVGSAAHKLGKLQTFPLPNKAKAIPDRNIF